MAGACDACVRGVRPSPIPRTEFNVVYYFRVQWPLIYYFIHMIYEGIYYYMIYAHAAIYSYRRVYTGPVRLVDGKFPNWVHRSYEERTWDFFFYFHYFYYLFSFGCIRTSYDRTSAFLLFRRRWAKFLRCSRYLILCARALPFFYIFVLFSTGITYDNIK